MNIFVDTNLSAFTSGKLSRMYDDLLFKAFECYGYDKDMLFDLIDKNKVKSVDDIPGAITTFLVDGKPLFSVEKITRVNHDDIRSAHPLRAEVTLTVRDLTGEKGKILDSYIRV